MTTYTGNSGVVKVGTNTVAEVRRFSVSQNANPIDDTALGDANRTSKAGTPEITGVIECWYDYSDTTGQGALSIGSEVSLTLYPRGVNSGYPVITVTAEVTSIEGPDNQFDEIITRTFNWRASQADYAEGTQT